MDREVFDAVLSEVGERFNWAVRAACQMINHYHLLIETRDGNLSAGMGQLDVLYTQRFNRRHGRAGHVFQGRYKSSRVDTDRYLLACVRYIELNPVRARMVASPEAYPWSSCHHRLARDRCGWLDEDPCYRALGETQEERQRRYRVFLDAAIPDGEWTLIREAAQRGQLTGDDRFVTEVEAILGRRIERRPPGRPSKAEAITPNNG